MYVNVPICSEDRAGGTSCCLTLPVAPTESQDVNIPAPSNQKSGTRVSLKRVFYLVYGFSLCL